MNAQKTAAAGMLTNLTIARPDSALIPRFTPGAAYVVDVQWGCFEKMLGDFRAEYGLDLEPDFQRVHVWTNHQRRRYVEYILRGGKTGKEILFNCPGWNVGLQAGPMVLVDGKQRMEAVRRFMNDELGVFGCWTLSDFGEPKLLLRGFVGAFKVHVNDLETRAEVLQWYLDLNSGGTPHTGSELAAVAQLLEQER